MKFLRQAFATAAIVTLILGFGGSVLASDKKCAECHEDDETSLPIGKTRHGTNADSRAPTCTACHGPSEAHIKASSKFKPDRNFGKKSSTPVQDRNLVCLNCHDRDTQQTQWAGSTHDTRDLACTTCHTVHNGHDKVRDKKAQSEVCFSCHKEQRTQISKASHHPVAEGKMACSSCHNVHGSVGPKLMKRDSVVETCYSCHMEKRGPFVHSHEPVDDDCSNCHNPHGTTAENLLKVRAPFLCQSCHTPHASIVPSLAGQAPASGAAGWNSSSVLQGKACVNCHTQIHGSNTPSSQFLLR
ncbi:MAG: DmsE family decaheme c-type cytochrome [Rhodoferax sp.]|nr:DmsE family decaheme c-type cytochrome [Rhodoferax sp.]